MKTKTYIEVIQRTNLRTSQKEYLGNLEDNSYCLSYWVSRPYQAADFQATKREAQEILNDLIAEEKATAENYLRYELICFSIEWEEFPYK